MSQLSRSVVVAVTGPLLLLPLPGTGSPDGTAPPRAGPAAAWPGTEAAPGAGAGGGAATPSAAATATTTRSTSVALGEVRPRWRWPLGPRPPVVRPFRAPAGPYGPGHRGVDLGSHDGADVLAVEGGVVTHAGRVAGRGTVSVLHAGGLTSTYEPARPRVVAGAHVDAGDVIGSLESPVAGPHTGPSAGGPGPAPAGGHCLLTVCLHLGARRGQVYVDPVLLLVGARVRLLPLAAGRPTTGGGWSAHDGVGPGQPTTG